MPTTVSTHGGILASILRCYDSFLLVWTTIGLVTRKARNQRFVHWMLRVHHELIILTSSEPSRSQRVIRERTTKHRASGFDLFIRKSCGLRTIPAVIPSGAYNHLQRLHVASRYRVPVVSCLHFTYYLSTDIPTNGHLFRHPSAHTLSVSSFLSSQWSVFSTSCMSWQSKTQKRGLVLAQHNLVW